MIIPDEINLTYDHLPVKGLKGLYYEGNIVLDKSLDTEAETRCVIAEELGHYYTSQGDILDYKKHAKQEVKARDWAVERLVALNDFVRIYETGCRSLFEAAEELSVTEYFLQQSIDYYRRKFGIYIEQEGYVIYFDPFGVMKRT